MFLRNGKRISHTDRDFIINNGYVEQEAVPSNKVRNSLERLYMSDDCNIHIETGAMTQPVVHTNRLETFQKPILLLLVCVVFALFFIKTFT